VIDLITGWKPNNRPTLVTTFILFWTSLISFVVCGRVYFIILFFILFFGGGAAGNDNFKKKSKQQTLNIGTYLY